MFGRVSIAVQVAEQAIVCPADAILKSRRGKYVLVERSPGKYENRPVKLGLAKPAPRLWARHAAVTLQPFALVER